MKPAEIEEKVAAIEADPGPEFLYALLDAYGLPKSSISRLRSGSMDRSAGEDERLWKGRVYFRFAELAEDDELLSIIDAAKADEAITKLKPRFLIVRNEEQILASDTRTGSTLNIDHNQLAANFTFFLPWAGIEKTELENINFADVKAAEKMAKLYDAITKDNEITDDEQRHQLNVFFSRLLFCFFAEDTGVFEKGSFTNAIGSFTAESGEDTGAFLDRLFDVLNAEEDARGSTPEHLRNFGYVNGNLFAQRSAAPAFRAKARALLLESGTLDWSQINPDIFGSMMQAVVRTDTRKKLGMHYTSVENIMKVIRPLFLEDLEEAFEAADTVRKLDRLLDRISKIQIFDPACGSGNFLVISYKELRALEHRILDRIIKLEPSRQGLFSISVIKLENFYGIEIEDFPHEIAMLSLWLAKHQMNREFAERFGSEIPLIPLRDAGNIVCANATRVDWQDVCDPADDVETYVLGNPPYLGGKVQGPEEKADFAEYFGTTKYARNLDYISLWFFKGAEYVSENPATSLGFVSTNSVSQGDHVGLMWPRILATGAGIAFAHQSFPWSNQARGNAGVTCVIVGLAANSANIKPELFTVTGRSQVAGITPYLTAGSSSTVVRPARIPPPGCPPIAFGSMPRDGGGLILSEREAKALLGEEPAAREFVRRYGGAEELLNGNWRSCLWIADERAAAAAAIPTIARRLEAVAAARSASRAESTRDFAVKPYRFVQRAHRETSAIMVPRVSSERRTYIPMGFVDADTVISDLANAIYDAEAWLFGLLQSKMHMVWVRAVAGALESRIRYSAGLAYNTFPVPGLTDAAKASLRAGAVAVLGAREQFSGQTLAELYDPDKMPDTLRKAHDDLDEIVDKLYRPSGCVSDEERLELLFQMYEEKVADGELEPANA